MEEVSLGAVEGIAAGDLARMAGNRQSLGVGIETAKIHATALRRSITGLSDRVVAGIRKVVFGFR